MPFALRLKRAAPKLGFAPYSPQSGQCDCQSFGFGGLLGMIRARLFNSFWFGLFDKRRIRQAPSQRVPFFARRLECLGYTAAFGVEVDDIIKGKDHRVSTYHDLCNIICGNGCIDKAVNTAKP